MRHKPATVYSGKVGAKARPPKGPTTPNRIVKSKFRCKDGPWQGGSLHLESDTTLVMTIDGQTGRYVDGSWEVVCI